MHIRHLRDKLILACLIMIVPFIAWNLLLNITRLREDYRERLAVQQETAMDVADVFRAHVLNMAATQHAIGMALWDGNRVPRRRASAYLTSVSSTMKCTRYLSAADRNGVVFASNSARLIGRDYSDQPAVRAVMGGKDWALCNIFQSPPSGEYVFGIVTGIRRGGTLRGMVLALMVEDNLKMALQDGIMGPEQLVITDASGVVALVHGKHDLDLSHRQWQDQPFVQAALKGRSAVVENLKMPDGEVMFGSEVPITQIGWTAGVFCPREESIAPVRKEIIAGSLIALLLTGFMIGVAVLVGNRIAKPVVDLARVEQEFGQGNLYARASVHTGDELQFLADSFNGMASALQERTAQLNAALDTAHHQSERLEALYSVAQGLIVSMDLDERLEIIAHALASIVHVKRSSVFLRQGNRLVGAAGWNLVHPESFRELVYDFGVGGGIVEEALAEGAPIVIPDVRADPRVDTGLQEIFAGFDVKGLLALPLTRRSRLVGLAILDNPGEFVDFDEEAVENARSLADLAAIAVENAQVFEKERNVAHALQTSLLPQFCGRIGDFNFACEYHAALEIAQLGGDLYDLIEFPDGRVGIVVADVSGKGLEAAVFTAMSKYTLRAFAHENPEPASVLARANRSLLRAGGDWGFVTMAYAVLDLGDGRLISANAGHPPYVLVTASGEVIELRREEQNPPLGIFEDLEFAQAEHRLGPGDVLVGSTDGITGARRDGEPFDVDRLSDTVSANRHLSPEEIARAVYKAVLDYSRGSLQDDIALIVLKRDVR